MTENNTALGIKEDENNISLPRYDSRQLVLSQLHDALDCMHHKAMNGRITKPENEKVRIQWFKTFAYTCSIYNQIQRDVEMDELREELETLKKQIKQVNNGQMEE